eukprot:2069738-Rhodomonas_salina.2
MAPASRMPSAVRTTLLLACIVLFGGTLFGAAFAKKVKRKVSENSDACKACKRILLSIQSVVVPEIRERSDHICRCRVDLGSVQIWIWHLNRTAMRTNSYMTRLFGSVAPTSEADSQIWT